MFAQHDKHSEGCDRAAQQVIGLIPRKPWVMPRRLDGSSPRRQDDVCQARMADGVPQRFAWIDWLAKLPQC